MDRRRAIALLICAAAATSRPTFAAEPFKPPLWVVRRGAGRVYLFPEMFAGSDFGPSPPVVAAFNESAEYWKEGAPPINPQQREALFAKYGLSETSLTNRLSTADQKRLLAVAAAVNVPLESLQTYRLWLVVQTIQGPLYRRLRLSSLQDAGVTEAAERQNKSVRYEFADWDALLGLFADMSPQAETEYLRWTMASFEDGGDERRKLVEAWAVGDVSSWEAAGRKMAREFPALYPAINSARNRAWVPRIQKALEDQTVSFIRVGAYHLFGPDSVQLELMKVGLKAEQIA
jgi:uncharacterized protein YbaP (TraB family)